MLRRHFLLSCFLLLVLAASAQNSERHFTFHYAFSVQNLTPGKRLRIWIPLAHSDEYQQVRVLSATGDLPLRKTREHEFGNQIRGSCRNTL